MDAPRAGRGFTLVLGGGGIPGMAYLTGSLLALRDNGIAPNAAELVLGTSAGALIGALVRHDTPLESLLEESVRPEGARDDGAVLLRAWRTPLQLGARLLGASWVVTRSMIRAPHPSPPEYLGRLFPGSLLRTPDDSSFDRLPTSWPRRPLWMATVDLVTGRRVTLGRHHRHLSIPMDRAVRASGAVPGVLPPVRHGRQVLVDGGVHSTTNLDAALAARQRAIICIGPMAYDPSAPPDRKRQLLRARNNWMLANEHRAARAAGAKVLLVRPGAEELADYPVNFLDRSNLADIRDVAREQTTRLLASRHAADVLQILERTNGASA